jgi:predicted lipoprotein with Yx(FWY)xxD motif
VQTATATVSGSSTTILTNTAGMTLYYRTSDTSTSVCSAGCAAVWPPLLLPSGTPSATGTVPGTLALIADANGNQVTYNGHPLYTFSKDAAVGDTKGEGVGGVWHVATPALT